MLLAAAALSMIVGETTDGAIILGIVVASGILDFWQERSATGAVEKLLALIQTRTRVLRDERLIELPVAEVVPGDVVQLAAGATVPGDCRILESVDLYVDEAALTGESFPAERRRAPYRRRRRYRHGPTHSSWARTS
jgi:Mg2+-importing ATPase